MNSTARSQGFRACAGGVLAAVAVSLPVFPAVSVAQSAASLAAYTVVGDAIPRPLTDAAGDAARGRAIITNRQAGLCLLCHAGPFPEESFQGTLAPDLAGVGTRLSEGQLRLRLVDSRRIDPATLMPSYYRTEGLTRVGSAWRARPVLGAQQIEDVVALLRTLRE